MGTSKPQVLAITGLGIVGVVANYSSLPSAALHNSENWMVLNEQGTKWLPGSLGGTYYNRGQYYSDGTNWITNNVPVNASQSETNTGTDDEKFVTAKTLKNSITKENPIVATNSSDYYRGDKTFQPLNKTAIGLSNVDNISDLNKPISNATQTALNDKVDKIIGKQLSTEDYTTAEKSKLFSITEIFTTALKSIYDGAASWVSTNGSTVVTHLSNTSNPHNVTKTQVGLSNVDNTSDSNKPISTLQASAIGLKEDTSNKSNSVLDSASTTKFPVWAIIVSYISGLNYITISALTGYATQAWVTSQNYATGGGSATGTNTGDETASTVKTKFATSLTSGSIPFIDSSSISEDNLNLLWDKINKLLDVATNGDNGGTDSINIYKQIDSYLPNSSNTAGTATSAGFSVSTSRGTGTVPTESQDADFVGGWNGWAYNGSTYIPVTDIRSIVSGVTATNRGGQLEFWVKADGGTLTRAAYITSAGNLIVADQTQLDSSQKAANTNYVDTSNRINMGISYVFSNGLYNF